MPHKQPSDIDHPTNRRPDLTIAKTVLPDWKAEVPYEEGVRRTLAWFRAELANGVEPVKASEPLFLSETPRNSPVRTLASGRKTTYASKC